MSEYIKILTSNRRINGCFSYLFFALHVILQFTKDQILLQTGQQQQQNPQRKHHRHQQQLQQLSKEQFLIMVSIFVKYEQGFIYKLIHFQKITREFM